MSRYLVAVAVALVTAAAALTALACKEPAKDDAASGAASTETAGAMEPDAVGRDLIRLCEIATEVKADATVAQEMKATTIAQRFSALELDPETLAFMQSMATRAPGMRYPTLVATATAHGAVDYSCPALEEDP